ncbi:hypothetical protein EDD76_11658 [Kineothrix alysoides]|uniref:Uncharacterized protein n=1 Tax=Kineothrix alysoides TaxID=1469948 RepID=A0A4R1QN94_9FIRM|nr:hypothetical protein [Kineothrix alysoides]TCL55218.1 hypothetical protein EDD76_11658 [Kineothrix alysoides]
MLNTELVEIVKKFAESEWDLIDVPSKKWLEDNGSENSAAELLKAVEQADKECGSCGCDFDPLYKRALELLRITV